MCTAIVLQGKKEKLFLAEPWVFLIRFIRSDLQSQRGTSGRGSLGQKMSSEIGFLAIGQEFENLRILVDGSE